MFNLVFSHMCLLSSTSPAEIEEWDSADSFLQVDGLSEPAIFFFSSFLVVYVSSEICYSRSASSASLTLVIKCNYSSPELVHQLTLLC